MQSITSYNPNACCAFKTAIAGAGPPKMAAPIAAAPLPPPLVSAKPELSVTNPTAETLPSKTEIPSLPPSKDSEIEAPPFLLPLSETSSPDVKAHTPEVQASVNKSVAVSKHETAPSEVESLFPQAELPPTTKTTAEAPPSKTEVPTLPPSKDLPHKAETPPPEIEAFPPLYETSSPDVKGHQPKVLASLTKSVAASKHNTAPSEVKSLFPQPELPPPTAEPPPLTPATPPSIRDEPPHLSAELPPPAAGFRSIGSFPDTADAFTPPPAILPTSPPAAPSALSKPPLQEEESVPSSRIPEAVMPDVKRSSIPSKKSSVKFIEIIEPAILKELSAVQPPIDERPIEEELHIVEELAQEQPIEKVPSDAKAPSVTIVKQQSIEKPRSFNVKVQSLGNEPSLFAKVTSQVKAPSVEKGPPIVNELSITKKHSITKEPILEEAEKVLVTTKEETGPKTKEELAIEACVAPVIPGRPETESINLEEGKVLSEIFRAESLLAQKSTVIPLEEEMPPKIGQKCIRPIHGKCNKLYCPVRIKDKEKRAMEEKTIKASSQNKSKA